MTDISYGPFNTTDVLYAALPNHGVYLSEDGGKRWDQMMVVKIAGQGKRRVTEALSHSACVFRLSEDTLSVSRKSP